MADSKILKLLVVEDNLEDAELLCEALIEIEERRLWGTWRSASIVQVEQLSDALDCLRRDWFDAILLNLSLPDSPVLLNSFLEVNAASRGTPIVVLADEDDESFANRLLREGAQDVFLKAEMECGPLARCVRYAIERQRRTRALRCSPFVDNLTGTMTRSGFLTIAEHYRRLSEHNCMNLMLAIVEIRDFQERTEDDHDLRELLLIRAGEVLRAMFPEPAIVGRLERWQFGLIAAGASDACLTNQLASVARQIEDAAGNGFRQMATVQVSSWQLGPQDNIEEFLKCTASCTRSAANLETVMLTD